MTRLDPRAGRDGLLQDMAEHDRSVGRMPSEAKNAPLVANMFERLEQKLKERKAQEAAPPVLDKSDSIVEAKARAMGWRLERTPDADSKVFELTGEAAVLAGRLGARLTLLLSKTARGPLGQPSWQERVLALAYDKCHRHDSLKLRHDLEQLCDESAFYFGDWRKAPSPKIMVDLGQCERPKT